MTKINKDGLETLFHTWERQLLPYHRAVAQQKAELFAPFKATYKKMSSGVGYYFRNILRVLCQEDPKASPALDYGVRGLDGVELDYVKEQVSHPGLKINEQQFSVALNYLKKADWTQQYSGRLFFSLRIRTRLKESYPRETVRRFMQDLESELYR